MTAEGQAHAFAAMLLLGMALGVVYDTGMLLRRAARAGRLATVAALARKNNRRPGLIYFNR